MASLSDYYREIRPLVKNVPDITLDYALNRAIRHFCRESWCYEKTLTLNEVTGQQYYPINIDENEEVVAVVAVERDNVALRPVRQQDQPSNRDGSPDSFAFEPPQTLTLYPVPGESADESIKIRLVLQPKEASTVVPDIIDRLYKPYIIWGAVGYIKEFEYENSYDPNMSREYMRRFETGINEAKGQRARGYSPRDLRIKRRSFL